jgi:hypothetical protein
LLILRRRIHSGSLPSRPAMGDSYQRRTKQDLPLYAVGDADLPYSDGALGPLTTSRAGKVIDAVVPMPTAL